MKTTSTPQPARAVRTFARSTRIALICVLALVVSSCRGEPAASQEAGAAEDSVKIDGASWTPCAAEYERCSFDGAKKVLYGTPEKHTVKTFTGGTGCDNGVFDDPAPGATKRCWVEAEAKTSAAAARFVADAPPPSTALAMQCTPAAPVEIPGSSPAAESVEADTPGSNGTRMFSLRKPFDVTLTTRAKSAGVLVWQIQDAWNTVKASGRIAVTPGTHGSSIRCTSQAAGYFAISARLELANGSPVTLPSKGTRPAGIATFGVLPDLTAVLPPVAYKNADLHRFGGQGAAYLRPGQSCCSGDGYRPLYPDLGLTWVNDNRNWYMTEPKAPNTFNAAADNLQPFFKPGDLLRLIQLDGIPGWANKTGKDTHSYAPSSLADYSAYMKRVGEESNRVRSTVFPTQASNYYQVSWEPDYEGGLPWRDSDANLVAMYKATYESIHATDPHAVVMGLTLSSLGKNTEWLNRLAPLGLAKYIDGVSAHGYYDVGTSPSHPPERMAGNTDPTKAAQSLPAVMRALRHTMTQMLKPGAKLFITESGISYDIGTKYGPSTPSANVLYAQGALVARLHLILLGEGADMSYIFYATDPPEPGYGIFFDLVNAEGGFGQTQISPKPAAMGVAAMTRVIDGTNTLGHIKDAPPGVYAYAFQRLNGGKVVTALWTHDNAAWPGASGFSATRGVRYSLAVDAPGSSGTLTVLDMMGNPSTLPYANGRVALTLTEAPVYVISQNADVMKQNVDVPEGYVAR
ncbi:hypothetical protein ASG35_30385 [Burkholderia sp. Leaf177]|uniref:hypothetical protein n=1 Tax=Burkholderia sp. Leaf177 TaxID=1736287 RepID=UPI0006F6715E|nr:hypothetical protein [Burkholderia sp. Leaf177]KQR80572.1 hypothetical protein ASG35_30385 [Burkholderia sp. Leaf177]